MKNKGFTLIELVIVISIIAVVSSIIMFSATQYINKGKDSNVFGNLAVLVPAGESFYNIGNTYGISVTDNFCLSGPVTNAFSQMPININGSCYSETNISGACCNVDIVTGDSWVACAQLFTTPEYASCVDSRGIKKQIDSGLCAIRLSSCN